MITLTKKLSKEEMQEILKVLFGFDYRNLSEDKEKPHWVLFDEEGDEFYGNSYNCQFNFSTLREIFSYTAYRAKNQGYSDCQYQFRKLIGITK